MRKQIKVDSHMRAQVPGSVFRQSPFLFEPQNFRSKQRPNVEYTAAQQLASLSAFEADPSRPQIYCVGASDALKSRYFASYLAQIYKQQVPNGNIVWFDTYPTTNDELEYESYYNTFKKEPDFLIIGGLSSESDFIQVEKARDIIENWVVPRVIVSQTDPIHLGLLLRIPIHSIAYISPITRKL